MALNDPKFPEFYELSILSGTYSHNWLYLLLTTAQNVVEANQFAVIFLCKYFSYH